MQQKKDKEKEIEQWERQQVEKEVIKKKEQQKEMLDKVQKFERRETQPADAKIDKDEQALKQLGADNGKIFNRIIRQFNL